MALTTIFAIVAPGVAIGFIAGASRRMDLEQSPVDDPGFGAVLTYLTGPRIIVSMVSFDAISRTLVTIVSVVLLIVFVFASGICAVTWVSLLKDLVMAIAAFAIEIGVPDLDFGGCYPGSRQSAARRSQCRGTGDRPGAQAHTLNCGCWRGDRHVPPHPTGLTGDTIAV